MFATPVGVVTNDDFVIAGAKAFTDADEERAYAVAHVAYVERRSFIIGVSCGVYEYLFVSDDMKIDVRKSI